MKAWALIEPPEHRNADPCRCAATQPATGGSEASSSAGWVPHQAGSLQHHHWSFRSRCRDICRVGMLSFNLQISRERLLVEASARRMKVSACRGNRLALLPATQLPTPVHPSCAARHLYWGVTERRPPAPRVGHSFISPPPPPPPPPIQAFC